MLFGVLCTKFQLWHVQPGATRRYLSRLADFTPSHFIPFARPREAGSVTNLATRQLKSACESESEQLPILDAPPLTRMRNLLRSFHLPMHALGDVRGPILAHPANNICNIFEAHRAAHPGAAFPAGIRRLGLGIA